MLTDVVFAPRTERDRVERSRPGRRARSLASHRKGKYSRHRLAPRHSADVAIDATLRAAAIRGGRAPIRVESADLRRKVREHRSPFAVCFVVDNSWSVHAERMIEKFEPFREVRAQLTREDVDRVLREGSERARVVARQTISEVRHAIGLPPSP